MNCQSCKWWQNHFPNDGGVCWKQMPMDQRFGLVLAPTNPDAAEAIGDTLHSIVRHLPIVVTHKEFSSCEAGFENK